MAVVTADRKTPNQRARGTVAISTNVDGITNADVLDCGGLALCGMEVSAGSSDANYSFRGGHTTSLLQTLVTSSGAVITIGTTNAGVSPGKTFTFDPAQFAGIRYIQVFSGTSAAAIAGQTGVSMGLLLCPTGPVK